MEHGPRAAPMTPRFACLLPLALVLLAGMPSHLAAAPGEAAGPVIAVTGGSVQGRLLSGGPAAVFRGLPFAQPPVGPLRWRAPQPVPPWTGLRDAGTPGPPALQASFGWNAAFAAASREDCLYLDVWTPDLAPPRGAPVMVWIHGGGNVAGAGGADPLYDGRALIGHGVVLVVIEYRLGVLGYFAHPELTRESPHRASGNYGILDQLAALKWVQDNIARFGGDPGRVTIFGQSAGGTDVLALVATRLAYGLFHGAIAESGPLSPAMVQTQEAADAAGVRAAAGASGAPATLAALRALPPAEVLTLEPGLRPFTMNSWIFPLSPVETWRRHRELNVPLIVGSNAVEFPFAGSRDEMVASIRKMFGPDAPRALEAYGLAGNPVPPDPLYGDAADQWGSDFFRCLPMVFGEWHAGSGRRTWQYEFDRAIPPHPRVAHSGDLPYVFGNLWSTGSLPGEYTEADHDLSADIQGYWTNFAKTGDPNGPGLPPWAPYSRPAAPYMNFTTAGASVPALGQRETFRALFRAALERPQPDGAPP